MSLRSDRTAPPDGAPCASCGTARPAAGRLICQACGLVKVLAPQPAASQREEVRASVNTAYAPTCALCRQAPPGPGGILCPACKQTLTLRNGSVS